MTFLRVDASIRHQGSVSRELTDAVERAWRAGDPDADVVRRELDAELDRVWRQAAIGGFLPDPLRDDGMRAAAATAARLADELLAADAVVIGAPMYNFGIPAVLKSWIDVLIADPRFDPRWVAQGRALAGVPVCLAVACGGGYRPGTPRAGWDHATPYLQRIFDDLFGAEVSTVVAELTAADADPALADLRPAAELSRRDALARAAEVGAAQARRSRAAAAAPGA